MQQYSYDYLSSFTVIIIMNSSYLEGIYMISAGDLRKGTTFEYDGQVFTVIDFLTC